MQRPLLLGERRRALKVHAREVDPEVGVAPEQALEIAGLRLAGVSEDDDRLAVGGQRRLERGRGGGRQLVVDHDRHAALRGQLEDLHERRRGGIALFFFKQKTAYEIRKGDWSSDVCSSD